MFYLTILFKICTFSYFLTLFFCVIAIVLRLRVLNSATVFCILFFENNDEFDMKKINFSSNIEFVLQDFFVIVTIC